MPDNSEKDYLFLYISEQCNHWIRSGLGEYCPLKLEVDSYQSLVVQVAQFVDCGLPVVDPYADSFLCLQLDQIRAEYKKAFFCQSVGNLKKKKKV